jgi:hypothetical protein
LTHAKGAVEEADWLSGDHRLEGVVIATGPEVTPGPLGETAYLKDLPTTALAALGIPSAIPRDGRVLKSLAGDVELRVETDGSTLDAAAAGTGLTSDEEGEIEAHLRGLGYVE